MNITVKTGKIGNLRTNLLAVFLSDDVRSADGWLKDLDDVTGNRLTDVFDARDFTGELNETTLVYTQKKAGIKRVLLVGTGKKRELSVERLLQVFGTAAKFAQDKKLKRFALCLAGIDAADLSQKELARIAVEGAVLSTYQFLKFKTKELKKHISVADITLFDIRRTHLSELREGAARGKLFAEATCFARDLASSPGNEVTPSVLAGEAESLAKRTGLKCIVLGEKTMRKAAMNALLGVAKGSREEPRLIILEYTCGKENAETVALVGKGITFDAGGISIKPAKKMEEMKYDMCGAAAVLGTMHMICTLKPPVNVVGVVASAENLPGGNALKPGDILTSHSGMTIEVINTDAEGRLVLCDALSYTVSTCKPDVIVDVATLTGAIVVALGPYATGMFGNNAGVMKKLASAARKSGEKVWEMPLYPEFEEHLKSDVADIKNSDGPGAGATFGAAFLQKFVKKTPWAHLDIAGTAWDAKNKSYLPKGPTGVGVRLLGRFLEEWT